MYNTSNAQEPNILKVHDHKGNLQHLSDSVSTDLEAMNEGSTHQIVISKPCSAPTFEGKLNSIDFKSFHKVLIEKVGWQEEAIHAIELFRFVASSSLLKAMRTGRFRTHLERKSASIIQCLLYPPPSIIAASTAQSLMRKGRDFPEEGILQAKRCQMKLLVGNASEDVTLKVSRLN
ncbi:uncharacterized protein DS421_11g321740 [Arachis hypogaea]|nr:uncharacterized protein DS421_11g321740 [Arachis hypogaea]